ncbi:hypothetical protein HHX47_DHR1001097 [Lentinula edodes]|nr:hypothetical protein HHX47_DHR1001097 [Lentinula edodes]
MHINIFYPILVLAAASVVFAAPHASYRRDLLQSRPRGVFPRKTARLCRLKIYPEYDFNVALRPSVESIVVSVAENDDTVYGGAKLKLDWDNTSDLPTLSHSSRPYIFNVKPISKEKNCALNFRLLVGQENLRGNYRVLEVDSNRVIASKGNLVSTNEVCQLVVRPDNYFDNALEKTIENIIRDVAYHNPMVYGGNQLKFSWDHSNPYLHQDDRRPISFTLKPETQIVDCSRTLEVVMSRRSPHSNYAFSYNNAGSEIVRRGDPYAEVNNGPPTYTLQMRFELAEDPVGSPVVENSVKELLAYATKVHNLFDGGRSFFLPDRLGLLGSPSRDTSKPVHLDIYCAVEDDDRSPDYQPGFDVVMSRSSPLQNYIITDLRPGKDNKVVKKGDPYKHP